MTERQKCDKVKVKLGTFKLSLFKISRVHLGEIKRHFIPVS